MAAKITGLGGVFLKVPDVEATKQWYEEILGFHWDQYGTTFDTQHPENGKGHLVFSFFDEENKHFTPSKSEVMLNFRVNQLEKFIEQLNQKGITIVGEVETYEYGKFAHLLDCNGMKIELWEPHENQVEEMIGARMP